MDIKQIKEFSDYYVSVNGDIFSNKYGKLRLLKTYKSMSGKGYHMVDLRKDGKTFKKLVHRLVAETFIPNQNLYNVVNHIDANIYNNCVDNLEWCTVKHNINQSYVTSGVDQTRNFVNCFLYKDGNILGEFRSINEACMYARNLYGVSYSTLNKYRKTKGFEIVKKV